MSSGDFVSLFPLRCAFGIPKFFKKIIRRLTGPQLPRRLLSARVGTTTTHPSLTQHNSTSTGELISPILIIRTSISFTRKSAGSPASTDDEGSNTLDHLGGRGNAEFSPFAKNENILHPTPPSSPPKTGRHSTVQVW
jgi:hypothetical protein